MTGNKPNDGLCRLDDRGSMKADICRHLMSNLGTDPNRTDLFRCFKALCYAVRDRLVERWIETQRAYYDEKAKRVYYLSLEFLLGRLLDQCLINLDLEDECRAGLEEMGFNIEDIESQEMDTGLGNGGLGRLAACFMDSMATLNLPAYGYGLKYDFGMFTQKIVDGFQVEQPDRWLRYGNPWLIERPEYLYEVKFGGRVQAWFDGHGRLQHSWIDTENVMAMPCDVLVPGFKTGHVINLRLWAAKAPHDFNLEYFQRGNYIQAVEEQVKTENISKVLYPSEEVREGRELRLKQEYFFVAATFQDILRRFKKRHPSFKVFPERIAIQLNDTHPTIAIPELMRLLLDEEQLEWEEAWDICQRTFGYTNHTIMPEALETWSVEMLGRILPRHLDIIFEINRRFLDQVAQRYPGDIDRLRRMTIVQEPPNWLVKMAHLAIVGSHSVNGVAQVHTQILKDRTFKDFYEFFPEKFNNKTNGVTPRRWLISANRPLSALLTEKLGADWPTDLARLEALAPLADDPEFRARWWEVKAVNKKRLADLIKKTNDLEVDSAGLFDVHVKRIHEYKRQVLNIFRVIAWYHRLTSGRILDSDRPCTVIFGGKAAPGYFMAKLIIKLINAVASRINSDKALDGRLKVVFIPDYNVTLAERIIPGADLSEQISTAGTEASGTGNMKLAMNGALTIGTLDGANIEIIEAVGLENFFVFGLNADQVAQIKNDGYDPWSYYHGHEELKAVIDAVAGGVFSPGQPDLFRPIIDSLLSGGDRFLVLADFQDYLRCQEDVGRIFLNRDEWTRRSILNVAHMARFSTDWTIKQYAEEIWQVKPIVGD